MTALETGIALLRERRFGDARHHLEQAVRDERTRPDAWVQLGLACEATGDYDAARAALRTAAGLDPDSHDAQHALGLVALRTGDFERAHAHFTNAVALREHPGYYNNLSLVLRHLGHSAESDAALRRAVELAPRDAMLHSNYILFLNYAHGDDGAFMRRAADAFGAQHAPSPRRARADFAGRDRDRDRPLRVAYLSPDLRLHAVAFFLEPLLAAHDPAQVHVTCYADVAVPDEVTERLRTHAHAWCDASTLDDDALERAILDDRIDVAVDLAGHTAGNRLPLFGRRVAPIQVSYLGYLGTTGVPAMDCRFTDAVADPPGATEPFSSEQLVRLAGGMFAYTGDERVAVAEPPLDHNGYVTFGSFNPLTKITHATLQRWSDVLQRVPRSRLLVKATGLGTEGQRDALRLRMAAAGMDPARLILLGPETRVTDHLARYGDVDIAVDTYPYNSITTAFEALWMGVPLVTRAGTTQISRFAASTLAHMGLDELVVTSEDAYVDAAVALAGDADRLRILRRTLRDRMRASPLCDASRLARAIEGAYRRMWLSWCDDATR